MWRPKCHAHREHATRQNHWQPISGLPFQSPNAVQLVHLRLWDTEGKHLLQLELGSLRPQQGFRTFGLVSKYRLLVRRGRWGVTNPASVPSPVPSSTASAQSESPNQTFDKPDGICFATPSRVCTVNA
jgi:hypothetical protein